VESFDHVVKVHRVHFYGRRSGGNGKVENTCGTTGKTGIFLYLWVLYLREIKNNWCGDEFARGFHPNPHRCCNYYRAGCRPRLFFHCSSETYNSRKHAIGNFSNAGGITDTDDDTYTHPYINTADTFSNTRGLTDTFSNTRGLTDTHPNAGTTTRKSTARESAAGTRRNYHGTIHKIYLQSRPRRNIWLVPHRAGRGHHALGLRL
jgi:hypothetical protein